MADEYIAISQLPTGQAIKTSTGTGTIDRMVIGSITPEAITATVFAGAGTGLTGTAASLTAGNVTTNANLTGAITSIGNATSLGSFSSTALRAATTGDIIALLGTAQTFTATQSSASIAVSSSSNHIATDASLSNAFTHTMTENTTLDNPTNLVAGTYYSWIFTQAPSAKTLAFGNKFKWPSGTAMIISTGNGAVDIMTSYYDGANLNTVFSQNFS